MVCCEKPVGEPVLSHEWLAKGRVTRVKFGKKLSCSDEDAAVLLCVRECGLSLFLSLNLSNAFSRCPSG